jgi:hypothetical protein
VNRLPIMIDYVLPERSGPYRGLLNNDFAVERLAAPSGILTVAIPARRDGEVMNILPRMGIRNELMARPTFTPTDEQRRLVKMLSGFGIPQEDIAMRLEISPHTLRKQFRKELDCGAVDANAQVANALYKMATSGKCPAATIFWAKTRNRWREPPAIEAPEIVPPQFHVRVEEPSL